MYIVEGGKELTLEEVEILRNAIRESYHSEFELIVLTTTGVVSVYCPSFYVSASACIISVVCYHWELRCDSF